MSSVPCNSVTDEDMSSASELSQIYYSTRRSKETFAILPRTKNVTGYVAAQQIQQPLVRVMKHVHFLRPT